MTKWNKELIRTARKSFEGEGISQQQLAEKVGGVTLRTIQRIEKGESGSKKNLRKVATVLGLDWNEVIIDDLGESDAKENMYVLRRVMRGEELFDVLRRNDLPIEYDYSPHIEGREKMDLVVEFFRSIYDLHQKLTTKASDGSSSPTRTVLDLRLAPILAGLHKENCGIFAKMFCSERQSSMQLEAFESILHQHGDGGNPESERKLIFYFYAANIDKDDNTSTDPSVIKTDPIKLSQAYLMRRFKNREFLDNLYADDDINAPFQNSPKQYIVNNISELYGSQKYFEKKKKEDPDYYDAFFESVYFARQTREIINDSYYLDSINEGYTKIHSGLIKEGRGLDEKALSKLSIEDGEKGAALIWHAWEIFNKRLPLVRNKVLLDAKEGSTGHFPLLNHSDWAGPENTIIEEYKRTILTTDDQFDPFRLVGNAKEVKTIEVTVDSDGQLFAGDIKIERETETIYIYSLTEEFQAKIKEFYKKIEENKIKNEEEVEPKDREAYRRALAQFEELPH